MAEPATAEPLSDSKCFSASVVNFFLFFSFFFLRRVGSLSYSQGFGKEPQTGIIEQLLCET